MQITADKQRKLNETISGMERIRAPWWNVWREISDYFLPRNYPWLLTDKEAKTAAVRNEKLLDSTSVIALRTLTTGMMNGITSPARPWLKLRLSGFREDAEEPYAHRVWLDEAARRMLIVMNGSNFYNALGILYNEWAGMGTGAMSVYEDSETVIRCFNHPVGSFYLDTDYTNRVIRFARRLSLSVEQTVREFGEENCSARVRADYTAGGVRLRNDVLVWHLVESNEEAPLVRRSARFREFYWETGKTDGALLRLSALDEFPTITPRWDVYATDVYGSSACMNVLPDVKQLQQMVKRRGQGLDLLVRPPMLINRSLASSPKSLIAGGQTYVNGTELSEGARPVFQVNFPFAEINGDIVDIRQRVQIGLFNDLFKDIMSLSTVRSATEIDARREEKLIQLGPVLDRFADEGLDPAVDRIFQICLRMGVLPALPEGLEEHEIAVEYIGILADAQRAVGTVSIERYMQFVGNLAPVFPEALEVPDAEEILRDYGDMLGLKTKHQRAKEDVQAARDAKQQQQSALEAAQAGQSIVQGAQQLSQTDLGGGQNALAAMLGQ